MRTSRWALVAPVSTILLTYVGYPVVLGLVARRAGRRLTPLPGSSAWPSLTVVVAAYNEEQVIEQKIADLRRQDYPGDVRILVVTDGSTDSTPRLALGARVEVLHDRNRAGKSAAVNRGLAVSDTDLVVLTDANCYLAPGALRALAEQFADPTVAVVGGVKSVSGDTVQGRGEGLYWRFETALKTAESVLGVVPGAVGELVALRRSAVRPIPPGVLNDDFHLACAALADGHRVRCAAGARTYEAGSLTTADELERRTRVAAGTWQTTLSHLRLLDPRRGHVAWVFAGHRVLRTVFAPVSLPVLLAASLWQSRPGAGAAAEARVLLAGQVLLYGGAAASLRVDSRLLSAPYAFVSTNLATLRGGWRQLRGRQPVAWQRVGRSLEPVIDLTAVDLTDIDLADIDLRDISLTNVNLEETTLPDAVVDARPVPDPAGAS
ncbi:MAG: poly-beta,6-N-acetyl-D-glucosamine synthase [Frankiaceae bacterium]|nr:poly-beta,6-N-acetyl-D-glucosamine synthase [Frankiaceae bacterium]